MGLPSFRRTAPKTKICDSYMSFKETCLFTSFFFVFKLFLNVFFYISAENFSSVQELFSFQSMRWVLRGRMGVVLHNSPLPEGFPSGLPHARRCAFRIKRQKLWRYCAAKREALSSGVLGGDPLAR